MNATTKSAAAQPSPQVQQQPEQLQPQKPQETQPQQQQAPTEKQLPVDMDVDTDQASAAPASTIAKPPLPAKKGTAQSNGPSSKPPSPKPSRPKEAPPLPSGSGLLTGALFGVNDSDQSQSGSSKETPDIILHVPLKGQNNQVINFARMAEEQYGFAALHPRLAAQRERLARVAAASAQLERNEKGAKGISAGDTEDDLSVDVSDLDGDIAMSGMGKEDGEDLGMTADGKRKRVRKKKIEGYDREDPFIDDSEMAWQEHAAASKDGFFVYSGPLIPEGEKVTIEKYVLWIVFI